MKAISGKVSHRRHGHAGRAVIALAALICGAYAAGASAAVADRAQAATEIDGMVLIVPASPHSGAPAQGGTGWNISQQSAQQAPNQLDILVMQERPQGFVVPQPTEGGPGWTPITAANVPQGGPGWVAPDTLANFSSASLPGAEPQTQYN